VFNVDQQVKSAQKVLAEDTAEGRIDPRRVLQVEHDYSLARDRMSASLEKIELSKGGSCVKTDTCHDGGLICDQMELTGRLGSSIVIWVPVSNRGSAYAKWRAKICAIALQATEKSCARN
jgi:hypothetical protein